MGSIELCHAIKTPWYHLVSTANEVIVHHSHKIHPISSGSTPSRHSPTPTVGSENIHSIGKLLHHHENGKPGPGVELYIFNMELYCFKEIASLGETMGSFWHPTRCKNPAHPKKSIAPLRSWSAQYVTSKDAVLKPHLCLGEFFWK